MTVDAKMKRGAVSLAASPVLSNQEQQCLKRDQLPKERQEKKVHCSKNTGSAA